MNNYRDALIQHVRKQLQHWVGSGQAAVSGEEVQRFLHSLVGTAGTIGLAGLSETARLLMPAAEERASVIWEPDELEQLLRPLLAYTTAEPAARSGSSAPRAIGPEAEVMLLLDEAAEAAELQRRIAPLGCAVTVVSMPEQALQRLLAHAPDVFIADAASGGLDTLAAAVGKGADLVTAVTLIGSEDSDRIRIQAYRLGADDYLVRPLSYPLLIAVLERQLGKRRRVVRDDSMDR
ncbi:hypothetical protein PA598K_04334 [Paenibacillus sp. 598K]|uniref:response regulator n=1 Tax=Paenibacillus sp. 598K TaxID=1117987 RepID=UPI000FFA4CEE|nr:Hpt domain-containing protein [Paenibacillus sp. 598K]GBF75900.1 hypothetical protein PA598K_04334 [Paenibacillus sp. 598K]